MSTILPNIDPSAQRFFGAAPAAPKSSLNMQTFLRLLTVQLANQNPLEPMNDRDFFAQMAQLGQVQGFEQMQKQLQTLQASSYLGKTVTASIQRNSGGPLVQVVGEVVGMEVKNGNQILKVRESNGGIVDVKFENVESFTETPPAPPAAPILTLADLSQMVGKNVRGTIGTGANAQSVTGQVLSARIRDGVAFVTIGSETMGNVEMRYDRIQEVLV